MGYSLIKKESQKALEKVELDLNVKHFCCVGSDVFILHDSGIALYHEGSLYADWQNELGYIKVPDFNSLSSICHNEKSNHLYIVGDGGAQIHRINLQLMSFETILTDGDVKKVQKKYLPTTNSKTYIASKGGEVIWSVQDAHRCFHLVSEFPKPLVGCGKSGYSISNLCNTKICKPKGVAVMENVFCFADSGNGCLRGIKDNSVFNIIDSCEDISDIHYADRRLFLLSGNSIHMLSTEGNNTNLFEVYKSEKEISSFCPSSKSCIYILENNHAVETKTKGDKPT